MRRHIALLLVACLGLVPLLATGGDEKPDKQPKKADAKKPDEKPAAKTANIAKLARRMGLSFPSGVTRCAQHLRI